MVFAVSSAEGGRKYERERFSCQQMNAGLQSNYVISAQTEVDQRQLRVLASSSVVAVRLRDYEQTGSGSVQ